MKRRHLQACFATAALTLSIVSITQWMQLRARQSINETVRNIPQTMNAEAASAKADQTLAVEVQFAQAMAILHGGNLESAEKYLSVLTHYQKRPELAQAAQFNLANGYLREALKLKSSDGRYRSLIELSKQRYRDLLALNPEHWEARYNLELALRLSPEEQSYVTDNKGKPIKSVSVVFPGFEDRELP